MSISILPHSEEYREAVHAFNRRMAAGGSPWGFYTDPVPDWIPPRAGHTLCREYYVAVDDDQCVRGGFALKPQDWLVGGQILVVADWQGPFSEGAVDPQFGTLGFRIMRDMLKRNPLLYSWGHGADDQPILEMLRRMGWVTHETPLCVRVVRPFRFLRHNGYLRRTRMRRVLVNALAWSGIGSLSIRALHGLNGGRSAMRDDATATEVPDFGAWADELWDRCKDAYPAVAARDRDSMNALAPAENWPPVHRLHIEGEGKTLGWVLVMDTQMENDPRFGSLRVGSVVDCFGHPDDAPQVLSAATRFLVARGVDVIVSNQSHRDWIQGFADNGYKIMKGKRLLAPSPALRAALSAADPELQRVHLTNMDGHGPHSL